MGHVYSYNEAKAYEQWQKKPGIQADIRNGASADGTDARTPAGGERSGHRLRHRAGGNRAAGNGASGVGTGSPLRICSTSPPEMWETGPIFTAALQRTFPLTTTILPMPPSSTPWSLCRRPQKSPGRSISGDQGPGLYRFSEPPFLPGFGNSGAAGVRQEFIQRSPIFLGKGK